MEPDPRIARVAEILIDKRDYATALVWVQVLEAASDLLQIPHRLTR